MSIRIVEEHGFFYNATERDAQKRKLLRYMENGGVVTQRLASQLFDCDRLPSRVHELRQAGVPILDDWEYKYDTKGRVIKKWKKYWIARQ